MPLLELRNIKVKTRDRMSVSTDGRAVDEHYSRNVGVEYASIRYRRRGDWIMSAFGAKRTPPYGR
jgi:hypothetical protein